MRSRKQIKTSSRVKSARFDGMVLTAMQRRMRGAFRRRTRSGQALVEFALVVPVMATLVLFAIYFYEINHIRLKTQEMARYAAWEFTGHPLHDYAEDRQSGKFNAARADVKGDVLARYANLESTNTSFGERYLAVGWRTPRVRMRDRQEPQIPTGRELGIPVDLNTVLNVVGLVVDVISMMRFSDFNPMLELMMGVHKIEEKIIFGARMNRFNPPGRWGFNRNGYIEATARVRYRNLFIPRRFMEGENTGGWFSKRHYGVSDHSFQETVRVVADSWRLHDGRNVDKDAGHGGGYYKAVDRMAWVSRSVRSIVRMYWAFAQIGLAAVCFSTAISGHIAVPPDMDPMKTALVSKAYKEANLRSGQVRLPEDSGAHSYDTTPTDTDPGGDESEYKKSFEQRGKYFMGCAEKERLSCGPGLSTNNPFGDYIVPEPEQE
jgi:hypothetical protein